MNILVISSGFPSNEYKLNGIFAKDQIDALSIYTNNKYYFLAVDLRSFRRKRKYGLSVAKFQNYTVYNYNFPIGRVPKSILFFIGKVITIIAYKRIVKDIGEIHLIHAHFYSMGIYAFHIFKKYNIPYIITEHSSRIIEDKVSSYEVKLVKKAYNHALQLICVSDSLRKYIQNKYMINSIKIPNIIDVSTFNSKTKSYAITNNFRFVSIGNLIKRKGMSDLIKAFAQLHDIKINTELYIIGDGEEMLNLTELIEKFNLDGIVHMLGYKNRSEISQILDQMDAFILLSKAETFGVVYVEAMSKGIPVIATKCGGPEDFINHENGILVDLDNIGETVEAMETIINNINKYDSKKISEFATNNFSSKIIAEKIDEVYRKLFVGSERL